MEEKKCPLCNNSLGGDHNIEDCVDFRRRVPKRTHAEKAAANRAAAKRYYEKHKEVVKPKNRERAALIAQAKKEEKLIQEEKKRMEKEIEIIIENIQQEENISDI